MSTAKKGTLARSGEWAKHLRKNKKAFWHSHRRAEKKEAARQQKEG